MWIILFDGVPSFWLNGGEVYRAGRKDCHVVIEDDPSISRTHLSFEVGLGALQRIEGDTTVPVQPAPLTLIDSSTYGSTAVAGKGGRPPVDALAVSSVGAQARASVSNAATELDVVDTGIPGLQYRARRDGLAAQCTSTSSIGEPARKRQRSQELESPARVTAEQHRLVKGTPFRVPVHRPEWQHFSVVLGNRKATLTFVWLDLRADVDNVEPDLYTKLAHHLNRCGVRPQSAPTFDLPDGSATESAPTTATAVPHFLVCGVLSPTPSTLAALLSAETVVVRPSYFDEVLHRTTPQSPWPAPQQHRPAVNRAAWEPYAELQGTDEDVAEFLCAPAPARPQAVTGMTFVVFQAELWAPLSLLLRASIGQPGGTALRWEGDLAGIVNERTQETVLRTLRSRHRGHALVYSDTARMPVRDCLAVLTGGEDPLWCVAYATVVRALVHGQPLERLREEGRRSSAGAVFPRLVEGGSRGPSATVPQPADAGTAAGRHVDTDGWVSRDKPACGPAPVDELVMPTKVSRADRAPTVQRSAVGSAAESARPSELSWHRVRLPPFYCFLGYEQSMDQTRIGRAASAPDGGKCFVKERLKAYTGPPVALNVVGPVEEAAANLLTSRVPGVDAADILPDRRDVAVGHPPTEPQSIASPSVYERAAAGLSAAVEGRADIAAVCVAFNTFDTAAHHAVQRKKAAKPSKKVARTAAASAGAGASLRPPPPVVVDADGEIDTPPGRGSGPNTGGTDNGVFNIFDIDGIF